MNKLNTDILKLAKAVSEKLDQNSECESTDFDVNFRSSKKLKTVELKDKETHVTFKKPNLLPKYRIMSEDNTSSTHSSSIITPTPDDSVPQGQGQRKRIALQVQENSNSLEVEAEPKDNSGSETDVDFANENINIRRSEKESLSHKSPKRADVKTSHKSQSRGESSILGGKFFSGLIETKMDKFLSLENLSDEDELWLIMTPQNYKFKKQHVDMTGRQELKGGKFEIQFFNQESPKNNMVTLLCENDKLVTGHSFIGCMQISEKLQTFAPVYHKCETKENPIPAGLKRRYIPFGADIKNSTNSQLQINKKLKKSKRKRVSEINNIDSTENPSDLKKADYNEESVAEYQDFSLNEESSMLLPKHKKKKKKKSKG